jgi:hypothetical protein
VPHSTSGTLSYPEKSNPSRPLLYSFAAIKKAADYNTFIPKRPGLFFALGKEFLSDISSSPR